MGRKRIQKIPKRVNLKCPLCSRTNQIDLGKTDSLVSFVCKGCEAENKVPMSQCCIICAYSEKKCPYALKVEANAKNLQLR